MDRTPLATPSLKRVFRRGALCIALLAGALVAWWTGDAKAETTNASGAIAITSISSTTGLTINSSGTYYLAADITINTDIAYAISITAANVTLDLNGHTISQLYAADNGTIGIYANANNVTVRNGTVTGFLYGTQCWGNNTLIDNLAVLAGTYWGISVGGNGSCVRHCRVSNIGGEIVPNLAPYAFGIAVQGGSNCVVMDCDVTTLTPGPGGGTICLYLASAANVLVVNNRLSGAEHGGLFVYSTGKYRDNLCAPGMYTNYEVAGTPMTDAGNNQ